MSTSSLTRAARTLVVFVLAELAIIATVALVTLAALQLDTHPNHIQSNTTQVGVVGGAGMAQTSMAVRLAGHTSGGAMCTTDADCRRRVAVVDMGTVPDPVWQRLLQLGYHGDPGDHREAIYVPRTVLAQVLAEYGRHA